MLPLVVIAAAIAALVVLVAWAKVRPFLAFILVSAATAVALGMPLADVPGAVHKGIGDILGSLAIVIVSGAMLGKLVVESGAAHRRHARRGVRRATNGLGAGAHRLHRRHPTLLWRGLRATGADHLCRGRTVSAAAAGGGARGPERGPRPAAAPSGPDGPRLDVQRQPRPHAPLRPRDCRAGAGTRGPGLRSDDGQDSRAAARCRP